MLKVANSVISASRITGVLPVVNGGTGVTTSTGTGNTVLSATPTLSGDVTLSTGNLVIGTDGKGIDFSVTSSGSGTMTSELLADYEEGTWTPTAGATSESGSGQYTKVGRLVNVRCSLSITTLGAGSTNIISGLPFTSQSTGNPNANISVGYWQGLALVTTSISGFVGASGTTVTLVGTTVASTSATANYAALGNGARVDFTATYFV